jgi:hypothetical protein
MIIKIFKDLKLKKIIDNRITIHFKDMSKIKLLLKLKSIIIFRKLVKFPLKKMGS